MVPHSRFSFWFSYSHNLTATGKLQYSCTQNGAGHTLLICFINANSMGKLFNLCFFNWNLGLGIFLSVSINSYMLYTAHSTVTLLPPHTQRTQTHAPTLQIIHALDFVKCNSGPENSCIICTIALSWVWVQCFKLSRCVLPRFVPTQPHTPGFKFTPK